MGALVPIEFSVPRKTDDGSHPRAFQLQGRVCRVAPDGIGLEFTDLSNEIRLELEEFVRSVLPKGSNLHAKAKASTIDRIEKIREKRELRRLHYRRLAVNTSIIATLLIVNFLTFSALERASDSPAIPSTVHRIKLGAKEVEKSAVRSIARNSDGSYVIYIESGEPITISKDEAEKNLPYELRFDTRILSSLSLAKSKRSSHTSQTTRLER